MDPVHLVSSSKSWNEAVAYSLKLKKNSLFLTLFLSLLPRFYLVDHTSEFRDYFRVLIKLLRFFNFRL